MTILHGKFRERLEQLLFGHLLAQKHESAYTQTVHFCEYEYEVGDRIGQLIILPYPKVEFEETNELSASDRGAGGYGSTGK